MRLTDGGVYDNLGLEPVWGNDRGSNSHDIILSVDGGKPYFADDDAEDFGVSRVMQYNDVIARQVRVLRSVRRRWHSAVQLTMPIDSGVGCGCSPSPSRSSRTA